MGGRIEVVDVSVTVGTRALVDRVSFSAAEGEIVVVVGPNGAGKSTLFEAIVGVRVHAGSVRRDGVLFDDFSVSNPP